MITIIHPTRHREAMAFSTYVHWLANADNPEDIEYILSVDEDDNIDYESFFGQAKVLRNPNKTAIEAINNAAKVANGDLFVVISDDFECFEGWDTQLLAELNGKLDFLLKTDDFLQLTLVTLPIMHRKYYERFGYVYHPDYLHLHADEEMTIVAMMLGRYIRSFLVFKHNHYTTGATKIDEINIKNNYTWAQGQSTLDRRALNNFGIEKPLIKREEIVWR